MQIIRSVEINYFRSIYQFRITKLNDLNIFVGGNDSGKSNLLRALNLFFNNRTSELNDIDFLQDVTHSRQTEAREAKGRLTIWIRVTFANFENWKSLPEFFSVKKVWNRQSVIPEISYSIKNSSNLQRFLNKINFIYVPAVKDSNTYQKYLRVLYETISNDQNVDLSTTATSLSSSVNSAIESMSNRIAGATGVNSTIEIPSDFRDLFERLSFSTKQDEFSVPLRNRGDGLQARHIPHILEFISEHNRKYNIWGYEEPENSLEMTKSFEVAKQFAGDFSQNNQIFVTSHSPSFYGLDGKNIEKYFIKKIEHTDKTAISSLEKLSDVNSADQNLGIAHIISNRSKALFEEIEVLKKNLDQIKALTNPVIVTEGKHDKDIIESAINKTGRDASRYNVLCCERATGEGGGASSLRQTLENIPAADTYVRVGIFDRDAEGLSAFDALRKFQIDEGNRDLKISPSGRVFALLLPQVDWDDPYFELAGRQSAIEQLFPRDVIGDDIISYRFDVSGGTIKRKEVDKFLEALDAKDIKKMIKAKIEITNKALAAERVRLAPISAYVNIQKLLNTIDDCIKLTL